MMHSRQYHYPNVHIVILPNYHIGHVLHAEDTMAKL